MPLTQFQWTWQGWAGAPGVTLFRCDGNLDSTQSDAAAAAQRIFLNSLQSYIPTGISITCEPLVKVFAEGDGSMQDQRGLATVPTAVTPSATGNWSAVTGMCVVWRTGTSAGRRMLMGRSFIIPCAGAAFNTQGQVSGAVLTAAQNAANTYVNRVSAGTPGHPVVWHRPVNRVGGYSAMITGATVNKAGSTLRKRRD